MINVNVVTIWPVASCTWQGEAAQMTEQQHRPDLPWLDRQDIMLMLIVTILALVFVAAACWIAFR